MSSHKYNSNYIGELLNKDLINTEKAFNKNLKFFHHNINEKESEEILLEFQKNSKEEEKKLEIFLLRQESNESKSFVLSILDYDKFKHIKIEHIEDSFFKIPNRIIFHGIESIIEKFKLKKFAIGFYPPKYALKFGITNIIHRLVQNDYLNMLAQILIHPRCPSLDSKNTTGRTALHESCFRGSFKITEILLKYGASVKNRDDHGNTALHLCCMQGFSHLLEMLIIDFNSDVNDRNPISGQTPLHLAVINNNVQVIKSLVNKYGAFLRLKTKQNKKAIDLANSYEIKKIIEILELEHYETDENDWFHEDIRNEEATVLLDSLNKQNGLFLIIKNEFTQNHYNLIFYNENKINNFEITFSKDGFKLGEKGKSFATVGSLVDYHCKYESDLKCILKHSLNKDGNIINDLNRKKFNHKSRWFQTVRGSQRDLSRTSFNRNFEKTSLIRMNSIKRYSSFLEKIKDNTSFDTLNISMRDIEIKYKIGHGEYGQVYRADFTDSKGKTIPVAIKQLKQNDNLKESKIMASLNHSCIVKFYGFCEKRMIILELVLMGSLDKFLKTKANLINLSVMKLWCIQIADAMRYLESKIFIHRDLASRNILVSSINQVKLSDFGMTQKLKPNEIYQQDPNTKIPYRWHPLESLESNIFISKSDVWSYGVTIWEILTLGETPFEHLNIDQVIEILKQGSRLNRPVNCPLFIYELMLQCWRTHPHERPSFNSIYNCLKNEKFNY